MQQQLLPVIHISYYSHFQIFKLSDFQIKNTFSSVKDSVRAGTSNNFEK